MRVHSTFPKCLMACVAVLSMLVMSGEGKHRAHASGGVREVMTALAAHPLHGGFLAWACGCLSNMVMLEAAALEFHSLGGVEYVVRLMKVLGSTPRDHNPVAEHDGFGQRGDPNDPLLGNAALVLVRACLACPGLLLHAMDLGALRTALGVLVLRGDHPVVMLGALFLIRAIMSTPELQVGQGGLCTAPGLMCQGMVSLSLLLLLL
jgi:hypothetical protein